VQIGELVKHMGETNPKYGVVSTIGSSAIQVIFEGSKPGTGGEWISLQEVTRFDQKR